MNWKQNNPWSLKFNTAALVLIPAGVGINYIGKLFAGVLKLPLWLDSIGTCLSACLAGPVVGAIVGIMNNVIYGLTVDPIATVYALTNAALGITVGCMAYYGSMKKLSGALLTGIVAGLAAVLVSTPLNMIFWGGTTGNLWGDLVYAGMLSQNYPVWLASFMDEVVVDIPDKIVVLILVLSLYKSLPKSLLSLYQTNSVIESLD
ncbi:ECF transporter S component [Streptococcus sp. zg-86]|uniref:ECF transporter S component n=1 Tax=Streptococcus zhangguiae TaxID=2664091 RepID=A0A6I4RE14_9STRE|nr:MULTISPECIES: ECF transporter S component [Streptococcus]MTB64062.1 ECF transporter S component [Streptococcus sp. zg-86]MTB90372.1 ECF transporter S component [Streptococcus sp. zg-36]MWV56050.1 ECF transporter S component [Streptococcus sp. zg-70]QTH47087.1 ECF transporter S component [Streptococcus sp. zg-86]